MRGLSILVLLVLVLPTAQPGPSSPSMGVDMVLEGSPDPGGLLISEVCPGRPVPYVLLENRGDAADLAGMMIDDLEGNITFLSSIILERGGALAITEAGDAFSVLYPYTEFIEKGNASLRWSGKFTLADSGDEALLCSPDRSVIDAVAYGTSLYDGEGWSGSAVGSVYKGHAMLRCGPDTDTAADWTVEPPGRSEYARRTFDAVVEPFSAPETAAGRIERELSMASRTVNCSVYEISDPGVICQLARCAARGLEVNVLIEGQPVGGLSDQCQDAAATLAAAGADVRELRSADSYKRYDYLHAKYLVVDGRRVTVMSENWGSGLHLNRGWGVTMDGAELGAYYERVFEGDFSGPLDVTKVRSGGDLIEAVTAAGGPDETSRYRCKVTPILSPDFSADSFQEMIEGAMGMVLVEQLSVDPAWLDRPGLLTALEQAAERGVKVRLLLDCSWDKEDNQAVADEMNALAREKGYDLEARVISPYHDLSVMHNKGVIIDDLSIVSSINWGDSALYQNREAGAAVRSEQVAGFFSALFWEDWALDPEPPIICLPWTYIEVPEGRPVLLDASNSSDNARLLEVEWDIGGDGTVESNATSWAVKLPPGNHTVVLTLRDRGNNTATATCWVNVTPLTASSLPPWSMAVLAVPLIVVAVVIAWKRINLRKNL